jgi:hypothetical protein
MTVYQNSVCASSNPLNDVSLPPMLVSLPLILGIPNLRIAESLLTVSIFTVDLV